MGTNPPWHFLCYAAPNTCQLQNASRKETESLQFLPAQREGCSPQAPLQAQQTLQHLSEIKHFPTSILVICRLLPQKLLTPGSTPTTDSSYSCCNCFPQPCFYVHSVSYPYPSHKEKSYAGPTVAGALQTLTVVRAKFFPLKIMPGLPKISFSLSFF